MLKDFDKWNRYKKVIDNNDRIVNFHEREVWWVSVGINVGSEQDSYSENFGRPVILPQVEYNLLVTSIVYLLTKGKKTPTLGVSEAEARGCTEVSNESQFPYTRSIENQKILSIFFGSRYLYRLAISTRM